MTKSKKYVGITIQVYAIAMFLLSLRNYAASSIRASGEILYYIAPSRYGILARGTVVYFSYTGSHGDYVN